MKPFVVLTEVVGGTYSEAHNEDIWVDPEQIVCFRQIDNGKTWLVLNGQREIFVVEKPEYIVEKLEAVRASLRAEECDGVPS
jgi:hypothetical protein